RRIILDEVRGMPSRHTDHSSNSFDDSRGLVISGVLMNGYSELCPAPRFIGMGFHEPLIQRKEFGQVDYPSAAMDTQRRLYSAAFRSDTTPSRFCVYQSKRRTRNLSGNWTSGIASQTISHPRRRNTWQQPVTKP